MDEASKCVEVLKKKEGKKDTRTEEEKISQRKEGREANKQGGNKERRKEQ